MENAFPPCSTSTDWKTLYRAAISEPNSELISKRMAEAEKAALARGRELFYSGGTIEEKEALADALYALRALKSVWRYSRAA